MAFSLGVPIRPLDLEPEGLGCSGSQCQNQPRETEGRDTGSFPLTGVVASFRLVAQPAFSEVQSSSPVAEGFRSLHLLSPRDYGASPLGYFEYNHEGCILSSG